MNQELYLAHHGIKGQKWGVRRYQNKDGTYTSQGKKHRNTFNKTNDKSKTLSPKTKKILAKALSTAVVVGGIAAYGKYAQDGKGFVDSYMKGISGLSNKATNKVYRRMTNTGNSLRNAKNTDKNTSDDVSDDIPEHILKREKKIAEEKMSKASELDAEFNDRVKNLSFDSDEYKQTYLEYERKKRAAYEAINQKYKKQSDSLAHYGIKGMHWGVRRFEDANGHLTPAGKRRYAIQDARKYYKINRLQRAREKTTNENLQKALDGEIRRVQTRSDRKRSNLSQQDINVGREIVAKNRLKWAGVNTAAKTALTAAGAAYLYSNPETRALAPIALAGGAALTYGSAKKVPYYFMENRRYKQVNAKGSTQRGLTKRQKQLRKIGKTAAGVALAGAAGYALVKSGAVQKIASRYNGGLPLDNSDKTDYGTNQKSSEKNKVNSTARARSEKEDRPINSGEQRFRNAVNKVGSAAKQSAGRAAKAGSKKIATAVKRTVVGDIDEDDPMTWLNAAKNVGSLARNIHSSGVRKAALDLATDSIIEGSNEALSRAGYKVDNIRKNVNKRRKK